MKPDTNNSKADEVAVVCRNSSKLWHIPSSVASIDTDTTEQKLFEKETIIVPFADDLAPYSIKSKLSKKRKWFIIFIVALQGFLGPLSSSIYIPAVLQVKQSFQASDTAINATISSYIFTLGLSPLIWATLSEHYGRRVVYLSAAVIYLCSTIGCALSHSIGLFIALRIFQSVGAAAAQAVGAGTITDLFDIHERGNAMGLFLLGALIGPVLGPIFGGFINQFLGWRYIFWLLTAVGGLTLFFIVFFLPETSAAILKKKALASSEKTKTKDSKRAKLETHILFQKNQTTIMQGGVNEEANDSFTDGIACSSSSITAANSFSTSTSFFTTIITPIKFMFKPVVILATTPYSMAYGFMYFVIATLPHELQHHYSLTSYQVGLSYLTNGVGNAMGAYLSGKLSDRALNKTQESDKNNDSKANLEARLSPMWLGIILLPIVLKSIWFFVLYATVGLGVGFVQTPSNTYIVDSYQSHSASVMSAANMLRCISAGCTPLVAPSLISAIGNGWSMTIIAILSVLSGASILSIQHFGYRWRNQ
ncbi:major facilitator superfamily domain-containing protein [Mycotypha africana]|uniref:major facilitator superfamily domain-containing protein n=1 Tax=Mycotypha africana TaxID=64632 RepID=UPI002300AF9E|nr:major facilitator superfamily domain-containing protein [Mycotypha africana]KAI8991370.1 major facilitator superfamily domain-containing protein [Mycotypha africana]